MKAVRYIAPSGDVRIGALDDERVRDAGPAGPPGFVPTPEAWQALAAADGPEHALGDVRLLHPVVPEKILAIGVNYRSHAEESELDVPEVPVVFAKWASSLIGPDEDIVVPFEETRPDFEGEVARRARRARLPCRRGAGQTGDRGDHRDPRRLRPSRPARDAPAPVHPRQELRHVRAARPVHRLAGRLRPRGRPPDDDRLGRAHAGRLDERPRLRLRRPHRLPLEGH